LWVKWFAHFSRTDRGTEMSEPSWVDLSYPHG